MMGSVFGGIVFGVFGDRLGRLTILFGSILIYSVANIGNSFV
jgi:putative MFS transporter